MIDWLVFDNLLHRQLVLSALLTHNGMATTAHDPHVLYRDSLQSARNAGLRYSDDSKPGITRKSHQGSFRFFNPDGSVVADENELARIKALVIPPAWTDVWICPSAKGHLQATGRDVKGRKQYRYHHAWSKSRNVNKFGRMRDFASQLPNLRNQLEKDIKRPNFDRQKVTATVLRIMDTAFIRVGNKAYAKANKSYGLTTLKDRHVEISGHTIKLQFTGKKGVAQEINIKDRRLASIVQRCKDIPGYDLFQYYDEAGNRQTIGSDDVNEYLRANTGLDFTAKDFRTWAGTVLMMKCLEQTRLENPETDAEKSAKEAVKQVASSLGNTPAVCTKYYIHPEVATMFKESKLEPLLKKAERRAATKTALSKYEHAVVLMLESLEK